MKASRSRISKVLFMIARSRFGDAIIGWSFAHLTALFPVDRLYETDAVLAFYHPRPAYPLHILIVPKRAIGSFLDLTEADTPVLTEVVAAAQHLVRELRLKEPGFRLMVNGGPYQDVGQIHFHLISGI
jgi:histidine triad (HIT) family protein